MRETVRGLIPFEKIFQDLMLLDKELFSEQFKGTDLTKASKHIPVFPIKVKETKDKYEVIAEVPGVDKENIEIEFDDKKRELKIKVEKKEEEIKEDEKVHFSYISYGTFEERIILPEEIDVEKINAKYENGVLKIEIPKLRKEDKTKKIKIS